MGAAHGADTTPKSSPRTSAPRKPRVLGCSLSPREGIGNREYAHQVKSHRHAHHRDDPVPRARHVPIHSAGKRGDHAKHGEGHGQTEDEDQGEQEGSQHAGLLLLPAGDKAHHQRDHGQHAGVRGSKDAAHEHRNRERATGWTVNVLAGVGYEAIEHSFTRTPSLPRS
jgi:hypothetical protein